MAGAGPSAREARRWRVPYEWILGAMFVWSFAPRWGGWDHAARILWLLVVMPAACRVFGLRRSPTETRARFGLLAPAAAIGWLYIAAWFVVLTERPSMRGATLDAVSNFLPSAWPAPVGISVACLAAAAIRPMRYRELGVFLNAAFLLVFAWGFDL